MLDDRAAVVTQIESAEELLRLAMLTSDVESLDALISQDLVFTTHFGTVITKQDDLENYRSGALTFQAIEPSDRKIVLLGNVAYVSVLAHLTGAFSGSPFHDAIRFSRVWKSTPNYAWQVVAGQATTVEIR